MVKSLQRNCGDYPLGLEAHDIGLVSWDEADMQQRLTRAVAAKAQATVWLMKEYEWDLFFTVFGETHPAAHYCWPDDAESEFDAEPLLRIYEALDSAIGKIVDAAGDDVSVFIISGDGVGPNYSGWHLLPEVLERLGYFVAGNSAPDNEADEAPHAAEHALLLEGDVEVEVGR